MLSPVSFHVYQQATVCHMGLIVADVPAKHTIFISCPKISLIYDWFFAYVAQQQPV